CPHRCRVRRGVTGADTRMYMLRGARYGQQQESHDQNGGGAQNLTKIPQQQMYIANHLKYPAGLLTKAREFPGLR
ncbi:MAG: hypothetical protein KDD83_23845, partial [Caldilineaceae bacterium]|nr:hypothetical protein [Caldilineaceae bacterium]